MADRSIPAAYSLGTELAAYLPPFDPLAPRFKHKAGRRLFVLSILVHVVLFLLFGNLLLGSVLEDEEPVIVRMLEPEKPVPEPPKQKRKVLAQRRIDAAVTRFKQIATPEIQQIKPVQVLDQTRVVEVNPTELTEAPKVLERREVVTETVSVFAEVEAQAHPIEVDRVNPEVRRIRSGRASAGPRKLEAGGPVTTAHAVDVEAPVVAEGVLSRNAIEGLAEGPRIAALESGVSDRMLEGKGERGSLSGVEKDCNEDPICLEYLEMIRRRVLGRWHLPVDTKAGRAIFGFRIDRGGSAHGIQLKHIDDATLGESCLAAFRHASPFPPPPKEILYITSKPIKATFHYGD